MHTSHAVSKRSHACHYVILVCGQHTTSRQDAWLHLVCHHHSSAVWLMHSPHAIGFQQQAGTYLVIMSSIARWLPHVAMSDGMCMCAPSSISFMFPHHCLHNIAPGSNIHELQKCFACSSCAIHVGTHVQCKHGSLSVVASSPFIDL